MIAFANFVLAYARRVADYDGMDAKQITRADILAWDTILHRVVRRGNGCWEWTGALSERGYGLTTIGGKSVRVHRVALAVHLGRQLTAFACHKCDNPKCCNPEHLFEGTAGDNWNDAVAKGRNIFGLKSVQPWVVGVGHHNARLNESDILTIRSAFKSGSKSKAQLQAEYRISESHLRNILCRRRWSHI